MIPPSITSLPRSSLLLGHFRNDITPKAVVPPSSAPEIRFPADDHVAEARDCLIDLRVAIRRFLHRISFNDKLEVSVVEQTDFDVDRSNAQCAHCPSGALDIVAVETVIEQIQLDLIMARVDRIRTFRFVGPIGV
jgi:hypothetical protein